MARELSTIKKDGVEYWVEVVTKEKKLIGKSATQVAKNLADACDIYGTRVVFEKAMSQIRTDNRNAVRGSAGGGKLKASDVIQMFCDRTLDATTVNDNALKWSVDNCTAAERMLETDADPDRITYPTIKRVDEVLDDEETAYTEEDLKAARVD